MGLRLSILPDGAVEALGVLEEDRTDLAEFIRVRAIAGEEGTEFSLKLSSRLRLPNLPSCLSFGILASAPKSRFAKELVFCSKNEGEATDPAIPNPPPVPVPWGVFKSKPVCMLRSPP